MTKSIFLNLKNKVLGTFFVESVAQPF